jgi:bleomycin hydrolase
LVDIAAKSIKAGEPVWFGCEVGEHMASKQGILDLDVVDYAMVFNTKVNLNLSKAGRLIFGDSEMNHAMVLTGVHIEDEEAIPNGGTTNGCDAKTPGTIKKWRIENSWGEDRNEKGFISMTTEWFHEFVFEIVVDTKFCSQEILDVFNQEPKLLPAWDPMGALAR